MHFDPDNEIEFQLQIGSKKFPESEIKSTSEAYYNLRKTMGVHSSSNHSLGVNMDEYMFDNFVIGIDTEKACKQAALVKISSLDSSSVLNINLQIVQPLTGLNKCISLCILNSFSRLGLLVFRFMTRDNKYIFLLYI